jgi:hypothetical protein
MNGSASKRHRKAYSCLISERESRVAKILAKELGKDEAWQVEQVAAFTETASGCQLK